VSSRHYRRLQIQFCGQFAADCKSADFPVSPNAVAPQTQNGEEINYFLHSFENGVKK
jgi:hypothetical protein